VERSLPIPQGQPAEGSTAIAAEKLGCPLPSPDPAGWWFFCTGRVCMPLVVRAVEIGVCLVEAQHPPPHQGPRVIANGWRSGSDRPHSAWRREAEGQDPASSSSKQGRGKSAAPRGNNEPHPPRSAPHTRIRPPCPPPVPASPHLLADSASRGASHLGDETARWGAVVIAARNAFLNWEKPTVVVTSWIVFIKRPGPRRGRQRMLTV